MLSGLLPFDSASLREPDISGIQRLVAERDPPRPSARLAQASRLGIEEGCTAQAIARGRASSKAAGQFRVDPLKAMSRDPGLRYADMSQLARTCRTIWRVVRCWLCRNRPRIVQGSSGRNRIVVGVAIGIVLLITGLVNWSVSAAILVTALLTAGTTLYLRGIRKEQARTLAALHQAHRAEAQTRDASWSTGLFAASLRGTSDLTVSEILDEGGANPFPELRRSRASGERARASRAGFRGTQPKRGGDPRVDGGESPPAPVARPEIRWRGFVCSDYLCKSQFSLKRFEIGLQVAQESYEIGMHIKPDHPDDSVRRRSGGLS